MALYAPVGEPSSRLELPDVAERPNQPMKFNFLKRQFGKTKIVNRSFQWRWLHYDESRDLAYCNCHICVVAIKTGKMQNAGTVDSPFIAHSFCNWKDASGERGAFNSHEHRTMTTCLANQNEPL